VAPKILKDNLRGSVWFSAVAGGTAAALASSVLTASLFLRARVAGVVSGATSSLRPVELRLSKERKLSPEEPVFAVNIEDGADEGLEIIA
jgi:hypothetical protein